MAKRAREDGDAGPGDLRAQLSKCVEQATATIDRHSQDIERQRRELKEERGALDAEKSLMQGLHQFHTNKPICLNIGGTRFETSLATLTVLPDSMLGTMFSGRHALHPSEDGSYFIDRDPTHFRYILNALRSIRPQEPPKDAATRRELMEEAMFYGVAEKVFVTPSPLLWSDGFAVQDSSNGCVVGRKPLDALISVEFKLKVSNYNNNNGIWIVLSPQQQTSDQLLKMLCSDLWPNDIIAVELDGENFWDGSTSVKSNTFQALAKSSGDYTKGTHEWSGVRVLVDSNMHRVVFRSTAPANPPAFLSVHPEQWPETWWVSIVATAHRAHMPMTFKAAISEFNVWPPSPPDQPNSHW